MNNSNGLNGKGNDSQEPTDSVSNSQTGVAPPGGPFSVFGTSFRLYLVNHAPLRPLVGRTAKQDEWRVEPSFVRPTNTPRYILTFLTFSTSRHRLAGDQGNPFSPVTNGLDYQVRLLAFSLPPTLRPFPRLLGTHPPPRLSLQRTIMLQQYQQLQYEQLMQFQSMMQYQSMMQLGQSGVQGFLRPSMPGSYDFPQRILTVDMMYAHTIDELKKFVSMVEPCDVRRVIEQSKIVPREMAFTSLIQMAGKMRQVQKAVAIFEAMKDSKHAVRPNMYSYTALISALARVGDWELAEKYFAEMTQLSKTDPTVAPNRVTFSSMISVYEKAKKFDSAIEMYERQLAANIQPDLITYLSVLGACQASRDELALSRAADILDNMHASKLTGTPMMYLNLLVACESNPKVALRVLSGMRQHGVEITPSMYNTVMQSLYTAGDKNNAVEIAKQADMQSVRLNHTFFDSVLRMCADAGDFVSADSIRVIMARSRIQMSPQCAGLIICAHMQGNDSAEAIDALNNQFNTEGVTPVLPVRKEMVESVHDVLTMVHDADRGHAPISGEVIEIKAIAAAKAFERSDLSVQSDVDAATVASDRIVL